MGEGRTGGGKIRWKRSKWEWGEHKRLQREKKGMRRKYERKKKRKRIMVGKKGRNEEERG